jgi:hypothetical protein
VEYPDPEPINDSDPPSDGGFDEGGTGYTPPPPPTPEEIKAGKRSQLVNKVGTGTSKKPAVTKSGTNKQPTPYGYIQKKPKQPPTVKTASGSKAWSGVVSQKPTGGNRYGNVTQQFLNPKAMTATQAKKPAVTSKGKNMLASGAKGLYNFVIGDSIKTLRNPNASTFSKALAAIDVATTIIPIGTPFKLAGKGIVKGGKAVANVLKEPIAKAAKSAKSAVTSGVSKAWGWAKGLVGKRKGEESGNNYQTYTKTNPQTGEVYSGRTSGFGTPLQNIAKRDGNHHMSQKGFGPAKLDKSSTNRDAIRGREQQLIDKHGGAKSKGGISGNKINSISDKNKNRQKYINAANKEFGKK